MKKNTVRLFVLAMTFAGGFTASAQTLAKPSTKSNISEVQASTKYQIAKAKYDKEYAKALSLAKTNNWPLTFEDANGGTSTLVKVTESGEPVYLTTSNAGSAITSRANYLQPGGASGLYLTGEYADGSQMFLAVWDGGYPLSTHQQLVSRTSIYDGGPSTSVALHPTHVTGTVIGSGVGNANAKGMASKALVASFSYDQDGPEMVANAPGLILSNHSYGYNSSQFSPAQLEQLRGSYIDESQEVDEIMFDNPYYQPVFAAGNDGDFNYDRLTDRSVSKNGIAVAAVYQVSNYTNSGDVVAAEFTSWGPTNDKRIKPDISNKGVDVLSASNASNTAYKLEQGTSMAAPGVTGALALVQQYYAILHTVPADATEKVYMRSATLRGLVAHTADEAGNFPGPDPVFGWGLLNVKRAADVLKADANNTTASIEELNLTPGQTVTRQITASGSEPLIATLSWTDPAGAISNGGSTAVLVNDLDIKLTKGSETIYPWKLDSFGVDAERGINSVDNIEKVEIDNPSGVYTLTISHKKATLRNPNGAAGQAYSLIISGLSSSSAGLDDNAVKMFTIWPNPASEQLNISFAGGVEKGASAIIYDAQGRKVISSLLLNNDNVLNVQGLAKGVYMVNVTNGEKTEVEKVIIK